MFCKNGFKKNANGCEICKCNGKELLDSHSNANRPVYVVNTDTLWYLIDVLWQSNFKKFLAILYLTPGYHLFLSKFQCFLSVTILHKSIQYKTTRIFNKTFLLTECPKRQCRMQCPNGFEQDKNGCEICKCKG